MVLGSTSQ
jgi:hypothetical protein